MLESFQLKVYNSGGDSTKLNLYYFSLCKTTFSTGACRSMHSSLLKQYRFISSSFDIILSNEILQLELSSVFSLCPV